jgi:hypothetical protein
MHITGKLLGVVLVFAAITGFVFAARLVDVRGKWLDQYQKVKDRNEKITPELAAARVEHDEARAELERESLRWEKFWNNEVGQFIPRSGTLNVNVGGQSGITSKMSLFAFQLPKPDAPKYAGAFSVFQLQPNLTVLKPVFRVRQEDVDNWTAGNWRLRTMIPSSFASTIAGLESELTVGDELLVKQQSNLDTQSKLVDDAKQQRDGRIVELLGGGNANAAVRGLVTEIAEADDARNASLFEVDRLRRDISNAEKHIAGLIRNNNELANTLQSRLAPKQTALSNGTP